jgi:hypothetical protein
VRAPPAVTLDELDVLCILIPPDNVIAPTVEFMLSIVFVDIIPELESTKNILFPESSRHLNFIEDIYLI